jgi:hypothetical protein
LGGDGSGVSSVATTTTVASLGSVVSVAQKEEKGHDKHRGTNINKEKKMQLGAFRKHEKKVPIPFQYKEALLVVQL